MFSIAVQRRMFFVSDLKRATVWRNRLRCARLNYLETKAAALEKCENKLLKCHANSCVNICLGIHYSPPPNNYSSLRSSPCSSCCQLAAVITGWKGHSLALSPSLRRCSSPTDAEGNRPEMKKNQQKKSGTTCLFMQLCVRECVCAPAYVATPSPVPSPPTSAWLWTRVRMCVSVRVCFLRV